METSPSDRPDGGAGATRGPRLILPAISGGEFWAYLRAQGCKVVDKDGSILLVCAPGADREDPFVPVTNIHQAQVRLSWIYMANALDRLGLSKADFRDKFEEQS